jgi:hypothetical protein
MTDLHARLSLTTNTCGLAMCEMYRVFIGVLTRGPTMNQLLLLTGDRHYTILGDKRVGMTHGATAFLHKNCSKGRYVLS